MHKRLVLFGMLGAFVILAASAFGSFGYAPVRVGGSARAGGLLVPVDDPGYVNFRQSHVWNNIYIPSMDVTGRLVESVKLNNYFRASDNFRLPHLWGGLSVPPMDVTGYLADSIQSYRPYSGKPAASAGVSLNLPGMLYSGH
jgi:hypothetical protein